MAKRKRPRGSRGARDATNTGGKYSASSASDFMVLMPTSGSLIKRQLQIKEIINRLVETGYSQMALVRTIYGRPKPEDRADSAIPPSLWEQTTSNTGETKTKDPPIRIYRRLHVILENLSDVGLYIKNQQGPHQEWLKEYDLVSVCPRNEGVFQSACATASAADIVTLDYSIRGTRLPYKIRPADVKAVIERGMALEIPLVPALLHTKQRKALVQTSRELQRSCAGMKPTIIFGSGDRTFEESDVGIMGFRLPGDITNLLQTVLHFDAKTAKNATASSCEAVIQRARGRRWGKSDVTAVFVHEKGKPSALDPPSDKEEDEESHSGMKDGEDQPAGKTAKVALKDDEDSEASGDPLGDGFIQF